MVAWLALAVSVAQGTARSTPFRLPDAVIAGSYYQGDGLGVNHHLTLKSDHTFLYEGRTDAGGFEENKGTWGYEADVLVLRPSGQNDAHSWTGTKTRFIPVRWGHAVTLVSEAAASGFFSIPKQDPHAGDDIHSKDYWKLNPSSHHSIPRDGKMEYPPRFADYVRNGAIYATVKELRPGGTVRLTSKTPGRIQVGTMFCTPSWTGIDVEVTKVNGTEIWGRVHYFFNSDRSIRRGDKLGTGGRWVTPHERTDKILPAPPRGRKGSKALSKFRSVYPNFGNGWP